MNAPGFLAAAAIALVTTGAATGQAAPTPAPTAPAAAATLVDVTLAADGAFTVDLHADLDALLLGLSPAVPATQRLGAMERLRASGRTAETASIERLAESMRRRLRVRFDGAVAEPLVEFPQRRSTPNGDLATLGSFVRLSGRAPVGAREFTFFASRSFRWIDLRIAIAGANSSRQMVEPGAESAPVELPPAADR
jgi:hypothetical protein